MQGKRRLSATCALRKSPKSVTARLKDFGLSLVQIAKANEEGNPCPLSAHP
jgi:hypothetical protein